MILLAIAGALLVAAGLAGLAHCVREGYRMRGGRATGAEASSRLRGLVLVNFASVAGACLGLAFITVYFVLR